LTRIFFLQSGPQDSAEFFSPAPDIISEKLINLEFLILLLKSYKMIYNNTPEIRNLYSQDSWYSPDRPEKPFYDSLLQWPSNGYFERLKPDTYLLKETLHSYPSPETSTVAEQVFGSQARQQKISLRHLANILYERSFLHAKHLREIDRRLMDSHEKLSILKMHFPVDFGRTGQNLERLIIQLEEDRRAEEINFWKDSTEIRQKLFEDAAVYSATKHRKDILYGVEG